MMPKIVRKIASNFVYNDAKGQTSVIFEMCVPHSLKHTDLYFGLLEKVHRIFTIMTLKKEIFDCLYNAQKSGLVDLFVATQTSIKNYIIESSKILLEISLILFEILNISVKISKISFKISMISLKISKISV